MTKAELVRALKPFKWRLETRFWVNYIGDNKHKYSVFQDDNFHWNIYYNDGYQTSFRSATTNLEKAQDLCWQWYVENVLTHFNFED